MDLNNNFLFFKGLIQWIEKNLESDLRLESVAHKAGYSKWYLQRQFRLYSGMSLGTYIRRRRLTLAAISLKATSLSPAEIALIYHWNSQQAFTRTFKKCFGYPPVQWRKKTGWDPSNMQMPLYGKPGLPEKKIMINILTDTVSNDRQMANVSLRQDKSLPINQFV